MGDPGCAERTARDRKAAEYNPTFAGAGAKVEVLCATPYGDILGASRDALRAVVRRRTRELAVASQTPEIKMYNNMISGLRTRLSVAFWRATAVSRICSRIPRVEWYRKGLQKTVVLSPVWRNRAESPTPGSCLQSFLKKTSWGQETLRLAFGERLCVHILMDSRV